MRRVQPHRHSAVQCAFASERRRAREAMRAALSVYEPEHGGVKADAPERIARRTEHAIADDRMAESGQLSANLPAPSSSQAQLEHGRAGTTLADTILRDGLASAARGTHAQRRRVGDDAIAQ